MDLIRKYLLENIYRQAPDAVGASAEPPAPPPAADPSAADPPADPPVPEPPAPPAATEHGNKGKTPWYMSRISEESAARRAAEERARIAEEALQLRSAPPAGDPPAAPRATAQPSPQEFQTAVQREAQAMRLYEDTLAVKNAGLQAFPNFNESLGLLTALGATNDDFVMDVLAVDRANAHKIYHELAKDPEKAAALAGMSSRARIAELTRMTMPAAAATAEPKVEQKIEQKAPAAPAKQVSKAPAPPPPVEPSASKVVDWRADDSSEEDFQRGWEESMKRRHAMRR